MRENKNVTNASVNYNCIKPSEVVDAFITQKDINPLERRQDLQIDKGVRKYSLIITKIVNAGIDCH